MGVAICALREVGIEVDEPMAYSMDPDPDVLIGSILKVAYPIQYREVGPGDMISFWWSQPGLPKHVAIYVGDGMMVHSYRQYRKTVIERVAAMEQNIHCAWRLR